MTKRKYYWSAAGCTCLASAACGCSSRWLAEAWSPLLIMGLWCWVTAALLAVSSWLFVRENEVAAVDIRPHPHEFSLYFDA